MEEEHALRKLASKLVEQVSGLTSLICSMEEQIRSVAQDNKLLRQQLQQLSRGICQPSLNEAVFRTEEPGAEAVEDGMYPIPSVQESSELDTIFLPSPNSDPMIYEVTADNTVHNVSASFEDMFDVLTADESDKINNDQQTIISPIPRLNRRFNRRASGPLRILAVEDDPFCQQLIRHIVNSLNVGQIEVVSDGVDAVINMSTSAFDLILMDIQLPRLDGLQAAQSIRKFNRRTPIVSMTSQVDADDLKRYFEGGIDEVLPKPFDRQAVMRVIDQFFKFTLT